MFLPNLNARAGAGNPLTGQWPLANRAGSGCARPSWPAGRYGTAGHGQIRPILLAA